MILQGLSRKVALAMLPVVVVAGGCDEQAGEPGDSSSADTSRLVRVVATTGIVTDWAARVGGHRVAVDSLVPSGADPHTFVPKAGDAINVVEADLVLTIGLQFEAVWLDELIDSVGGTGANIVRLGEFADPITMTGGGEQPDPHFWFDPLRVSRVVTQIALELANLSPADRDIFKANAAVYNLELFDLDEFIIAEVARVGVEQRLLVTSHDSLEYFAQRYGFEVLGTVMPGLNPDAEPTAQEMTDLTQIVKEHDVAAIFGETTASERLAKAIATETGATLVSLFSGSLGETGSGADTYVGMMRTNAVRVVQGLIE